MEESQALTQISMQSDFWQNNLEAQSVMSRLSLVNGKIALLQSLSKTIHDCREILENFSDTDFGSEISQELISVQAKINELEFEQSFNGKYDYSAAILSVHAGAGGVDSQDFASMLVSMYLKWADLHNFKTQILDVSEGEEAGIKSQTLEISGPYAYGNLRAEHGVHRLVRLSPFDSDHARHTSFAKVEVVPSIREGTEISIKPSDVRIEAFRSSGPGGQNVQKVSTAVRVIHLPTGMAVTSQTERSQIQNKESAMRILHGKLLAIAMEKEAAEKARLKGKNISTSWGNQIRSYVLHPYRMVKDHRTEYETSDTEGVLSGHLDDFINAYLRGNINHDI